MTEGPKDVSVEEFQDTLEYVLKNAYKTRDADAKVSRFFSQVSLEEWQVVFVKLHVQQVNNCIVCGLHKLSQL